MKDGLLGWNQTTEIGKSIKIANHSIVEAFSSQEDISTAMKKIINISEESRSNPVLIDLNHQ